MRNHSLFLCAEGAGTLQASCRMLLLSNYLCVESHIQETCFRITRDSYLCQGCWRTGSVVFSKELHSHLLCHGTTESSHLQTSFSLWSLRLLGARSQIFSMTGFKKIIYIILSSVSFLPKFVSYSL